VTQLVGVDVSDVPWVRWSYPAEFRKRVLDRLDAGHSVTAIAQDLGITGQTIYNWRNQHLIDTGQRDGVTSSEHVELVAARKRIASLEADLAASQNGGRVVEGGGPPKRRVEAVRVMVSEAHSSRPRAGRDTAGV